MLTPSTTARIDTALLAEYGERMTPACWTPPDTTRLALRYIGRQINRLTASRTQAKNRLHALQAKGMTLSLLLEDEQEGIALLNRRITRLQEAALALVSTTMIEGMAYYVTSVPIVVEADVRTTWASSSRVLAGDDDGL